jgi:hypothetical protein
VLRGLCVGSAQGEWLRGLSSGDSGAQAARAREGAHGIIDPKSGGMAAQGHRPKMGECMNQPQLGGTPMLKVWGPRGV